MVSDAHEGIKASVAKVMTASWQRCRVHFMRNVLAHAGRSGRRVVSAFIATAFAQDDAEAARQQWRRVADQLRPKMPKLAALMDTAETDVLAYMGFPAAHRTKLHSTNPLERLNGEIKRRTEVVGIFPDEPSIRRLVGAILLEQNDEWAVQRCRTMTLESIARSAMIPSSACQTSQSDQAGPAGHRGGPHSATPRHGTRSFACGDVDGRPCLASHLCSQFDRQTLGGVPEARRQETGPLGAEARGRAGQREGSDQPAPGTEDRHRQGGDVGSVIPEV